MTDSTDLSRYSALETLRDGRVIEIRAIKPEDREGLLNVVDRASKESFYRRFFSAKRDFSEKEIDYFMDVDFVKQGGRVPGAGYRVGSHATSHGDRPERGTARTARGCAAGQYLHAQGLREVRVSRLDEARAGGHARYPSSALSS